MWKALAVFLIALFLVGVSAAMPMSDDKASWNKTRALKELPFCAFILRDFLLEESSPEREIFILMEPDEVTEENLKLLFKVVSEKYLKPLALKVWVKTDIEDLKELATGVMITGDPPPKNSEVSGKEKIVSSNELNKKTKRIRQWAFYIRNEDVELFRYNPDYPEEGMKTVMLRGSQ
jgi:hypothetical protein